MNRKFALARFALMMAAGFASTTALGEEPAPAQDSTPTSLSALAGMSLEDLANVEVSSVSRRKERQQVAAAAVYVITAEDIAHSTARTIPDLLRAVPGLQVARLDANKWSVSSRGFSGRYANSLLVLIDGRSVYTPFFSGTYWETKDVPLGTIDRIEIIRGPGGALWGANAVNGVINIVTKNAADTLGGELELGGGTEHRAFGTVRYGGNAGQDGHYRLYLKYADHDEARFESGSHATDDWLSVRGGARFDWNWADSQLMVEGDFYGVDTSQRYEVPTLALPFSELRDEESYFSGGNLLARWTKSYADGAELRLQAYYDRSDSNIFTIDEESDTFDIDLQYRFAPIGRHEFLVGAAFRYIDERMDGTGLVSVSPDSWNTRLFSAFVQDRIELIEDTLVLTVGSKFEVNDFTDFEFQPNLRLAWTPNETHTLWAAVSRAVRTPAIVEHGGQVASQAFPGTLISLYGNRDYESEDLLAFELGYRAKPSETVYFDLALFLNKYENLRTLEIGVPFLELSPPPLHIAVPNYTRNNMKGVTYGVEMALDWELAPWWRARLNYSWLQMDLDPQTKGLDLVSESLEESSPEQQVYLENRFELSPRHELNVIFRYVDSLPALGIDDYFTMDLGFSWRPTDDFELRLVGHDLLESEHAEFSSMFVNTIPTEVQRGVYGSITWRF